MESKLGDQMKHDTASQRTAEYSNVNSHSVSIGLLQLSCERLCEIGWLLIRHEVSLVLSESRWNIIFAAAAVSRQRPHNESIASENRTLACSGRPTAEQDVRSFHTADAIDRHAALWRQYTVKRDGAHLPRSCIDFSLPSLFTSTSLEWHWLGTWKASWSCSAPCTRIALPEIDVTYTCRSCTDVTSKTMAQTKPTPTVCIAQHRVNERMHACTAFIAM